MTTQNSSNLRRLKIEMDAARESRSKELKILPCIDGDTLKWKSIMRPSPSSIYHDTDLELVIYIPENYPYNPPRIEFITPVYHPNINASGSICISTLGKDWSPALTIEKTLLSIMSMLDEPNPNDPLRPDVAVLYESDRDHYIEMVRNVCEANKRSKR